MTDERADIMLEILKNIQADVAAIKKEQTSQGIRLLALEDHIRGLIGTIYGIQSDVADLKMRVDRIEKRLGLADTEH
ncbi:pre-mRNA-splicing factor SPF27 family protein [Sphingomonas endolithica]|uniref:pre-mRNA-splicing factor SPF27 family protein n=1 Tax=Sphingomonas endolithica TaxID=2972485 RepID=UPI0021AFB2F1|nr:pre-mRNA-splicing factor SPF27 family protein [Sphingomonas sp. ZFBP2030]